MSSSGFGSSSSLLRGRRFYCREWALDKLRRCLDAHSGPGQAPGVLVTGGPGAGKTALCTEVVSPTSKAGLAVGLAQRCLAAHFCQREDQRSTVLWRFVLGLVEQLRASPLLSPGYEELLNSPSVSSALEPLTCQRDPNETFKRFVSCFFFSLFWCPTKRLRLIPSFEISFAETNLWEISHFFKMKGKRKLPETHPGAQRVCARSRAWLMPSSSQQNLCGGL